MSTQHVYRLVVDEIPPEPQPDCWRCDSGLPEETGPDSGFYLCGECGVDLSPARIGGKRRNFLSRGAAQRRADLINGAAGKAHVEKSGPIVWPDPPVVMPEPVSPYQRYARPQPVADEGSPF